MYDGKQVVRFVNNYKSKDLYNIGNEMIKRVGTGNYEKERTKFNVHYKDIDEKNLYQEVKSILENRNIEYLNKSKTNVLNGVTFTSVPEFFQTLGMPFKNTFQKYQSGNKKGQNIFVPNIKDKNDIPKEVTRYFDCCMKFLKNLVGEENIVMAQVHYDEDTPHLQAYFLPVVNEVKRKCYKRDKDGNLIKEITTDKNGKEKSVPILLRDADNKIIYETVKGKFLNNDQFWKDLGGQNSFAHIQDSFNKFITEKGFRLDRGEIGSTKVHQDKLEYQYNQYKEKLKTIEEDIRLCNKEYETITKNIKESLNTNLNELNIKKGVVGYNSKDVDKLIDYATNLERLNNINQNEIKKYESKNRHLTIQNYKYENNKELLAKSKDNFEMYKKIEGLNDDLDYWKKGFKKLANALDIILKSKPKLFASDYIRLAEDIKASKHLNEEDEKAAKEFSKLFNNDDYQR